MAGVLEWGAMSGTDRRAAALAGHRGDEAGARAALGSADPAVRSTALGALVRLGVVTAEDLGAALADPAPAVRRRAAEEAGRAGPAGAAVGAVLVALLDADDATVAEAAAFALGEVDAVPDDAVDALARVAGGHEDVLVREAAVAALGSIGDPRGRDTVLRAATDVATVRRRAVLALAAFEGEAVEAALATLATDRDRQVRQAAEDLLHGWGTGD